MNTPPPFTDPAMIADYVAATPRKVPGFADLHRMAMLLLAERAPAAADMLVVGAGGGLELKAFAGAQPDWRLVGVDPSAAMLDLARCCWGRWARASISGRASSTARRRGRSTARPVCSPCTSCSGKSACTR